MLTKGQIISIKSDNMYSVRVPIFEGAGNKTAYIVDAGCIIPPGVFNGYVVGDIVEVGFEENTIKNAVILGKVYLGQEEEIGLKTGAVNVNSITASTSATLPLNTKIGDTTITELLNEINSLKLQIATLQANVMYKSKIDFYYGFSLNPTEVDFTNLTKCTIFNNLSNTYIFKTITQAYPIIIVNKNINVDTFEPVDATISWTVTKKAIGDYTIYYANTLIGEYVIKIKLTEK